MQELRWQCDRCGAEDQTNGHMPIGWLQVGFDPKYRKADLDLCGQCLEDIAQFASATITREPVTPRRSTATKAHRKKADLAFRKDRKIREG